MRAGMSSGRECSKGTKLGWAERGAGAAQAQAGAWSARGCLDVVSQMPGHVMSSRPCGQSKGRVVC
jgi:hypothetical protein